jgi:hypothetical protein
VSLIDSKQHSRSLPGPRFETAESGANRQSMRIRRFAGRFRLGFQHLVLAVIIAASCGTAAVWAVGVPIFLSPDESAHADYAFALYDAGKPFRVKEARPETLVTAQARYLAEATEYRRLRYSTFARVPPEFGTARYRARIDAGAPRPSHAVPPEGAAMPYVMFSYPIGYYGLIAFAMAIVGGASHDSLTTIFYVARLANVGLLAITLILTYFTFRAYRLRISTALLATLALGMFPMVSWVAGYIQPDNLSFCLITATLCPIATWRPKRLGFWQTGVVSILIAALFFTKQHYAIALYIAALPAVLTRLRPRLLSAQGFASSIAMLAVPILAAVESSKVTPVSELSDARGYVSSIAAPGHALDAARVLSLAQHFSHGLIDIFFDGIGFGGYWFRFGVRGGAIYNREAVTVLSTVIELFTVASVIMLAVVFIRFVGRLRTIANKRSPRIAFSLAAGSVTTTLYMVTTVIILAVYAVANGVFALQGRYWLPVEVCSFVTLLVAMPRIITPTQRRSAKTLLAGLLAAFSVCSTPFALAAMHRQYYEPDPRRLEASLADFETVAIGSLTTDRLDEPILVRRGALTVRGYDVDPRTGLPGRGVDINVDGHLTIRARAGVQRPDMVGTFHDDELKKAGFYAVIPQTFLSLGKHVVRALIVDPRFLVPIPLHRVLEIDVRS